MSENGDSTGKQSPVNTTKDTTEHEHEDNENEKQLEANAELMKKVLTEFLPTITMSVAKHVEARMGHSKSNTEDYEVDERERRHATRRDDELSLFASESNMSPPPLPKRLRDSAAGSTISRLEKENSPPNKKSRGGSIPDGRGVFIPDDILHGGFNPINTKGKSNPDQEHRPLLDLSEEVLQECEDSFEFHQEYNPPINDGLAKRAVKFFKAGMEQKEVRSNLFKANKLASNLEAIDTPRINPGVLELKTVQKYQKHTEGKLFDVQQNITRSTMAMLKVADEAIKDENAGHAIDLKKVLSGTLNAVLLMGYASNEVSNKRKSNLRYCLDPPMQPLCDASRPTTKYLLGDDIFKSADDVSKIQRLARKPSRTQTSSSSTTSSSHQNRDSSRDGWSNNSKNKPDDKRSSSSTSKSSKPFLGKGQTKPKGKK